MMQTASAILIEDRRSQETLDAHTQAVERAIHVMHTHHQEMLTLADLADAACLSPFHFNRIFRRIIGIPPNEFLVGLRLQLARKLLLTTSLRVTDICFEVGYNSPGSFTTRFTQLVGMSPRILRQRAHEFEPPPIDIHAQTPPSPRYHILGKNTVEGRISTPPYFQGTICVGLFTRPIAQGTPVSCARLFTAGPYKFTHVPDGVYYLLASAFPRTPTIRTFLLSGENVLLAKNDGPVIIHNGHIAGKVDLVLRAPRITDPPVVMALPLR